MCGRLNLLDAEGVILLLRTLGFRPIGLQAWQGDRIKQAPTDPVLVATRDHEGVIDGVVGEKLCCPMSWWLTPHWARSKSRQYNLFNARAETVASSPAFRSAYRYRRAVVVSSGFIEWQRVAAGKQPLWIRPPAEQPCSFFAAIWDPWEADGSLGVAILTTAASEGFREVHERMPVVLDSQQLDTWLARDTASEDLQRFLQPRAIDDWQRLPLPKSINHAANKQVDLFADSKT